MQQSQFIKVLFKLFKVKSFGVFLRLILTNFDGKHILRDKKSNIYDKEREKELVKKRNNQRKTHWKVDSVGHLVLILFLCFE